MYVLHYSQSKQRLFLITINRFIFVTVIHVLPTKEKSKNKIRIAVIVTGRGGL
jgi:hypothetical protein